MGCHVEKYGVKAGWRWVGGGGTITLLGKYIRFGEYTNLARQQIHIDDDYGQSKSQVVSCLACL